MNKSVRFMVLLRWSALFWTGWVLISAAVSNGGHPRLPGVADLLASMILNMPLLPLSLFILPACRWIDWRRTSILLGGMLHLVFAVLFGLSWLAACLGFVALLSSTSLPMPSLSAGVYLQHGILLYAAAAAAQYAWAARAGGSGGRRPKTGGQSSRDGSSARLTMTGGNPRFLASSLREIHRLIESKPGSARQMVERLSELLDQMRMDDPESTVTLDQELELVHHYIALEKIRLADRLRFEEEVDPDLRSYPIPSMFLQPIIDSAIEHGPGAGKRGGYVSLRIAKEKNQLQGVVESRPEGGKRSAEPGARQGLVHLQRRLAHLYGHGVQFSAATVPESEVFRVQFQFPVNGDPQS